MLSIRTMLLAGATFIALTSLHVAGNANAGDWGGNAAYCQWYKQQAMNTGDEYWWDRWRRCMRGDFWD